MDVGGAVYSLVPRHRTNKNNQQGKQQNKGQ